MRGKVRAVHAHLQTPKDDECERTDKDKPSFGKEGAHLLVAADPKLLTDAGPGAASRAKRYRERNDMRLGAIPQNVNESIAIIAGWSARESLHFVPQNFFR